MSAWYVVAWADVLAMGATLLVLVWAAAERGRIHTLVRHRSAARVPGAAYLLRFHLAICSAVGAA